MMGILRGRRGGDQGRVVAIPGPDSATRGPIGPCIACGTDDSGIRVPLVIDGTRGEGDREVIVVCLDGHECGVRYRGGVSPETYAAGLRGELLAVAP